MIKKQSMMNYRNKSYASVVVGDYAAFCLSLSIVFCLYTAL